MWDIILVTHIHMFMVVWLYMEPAIITTPGIDLIIIHARLPGDLGCTGIPGQVGDFLLDSDLVGSVGVFILIVVGGVPVDIVTDIVMAIVADTVEVPGQVTGPVIGRASEMLQAMFTVTDLPVLKREMSGGLKRVETQIHKCGHRQNRTTCIRIKKEMFTRKIKMAIGIKNPIKKQHREAGKNLRQPKIEVK